MDMKLVLKEELKKEIESTWNLCEDLAVTFLEIKFCCADYLKKKQLISVIHAAQTIMMSRNRLMSLLNSIIHDSHFDYDEIVEENKFIKKDLLSIEVDESSIGKC